MDVAALGRRHAHRDGRRRARMDVNGTSMSGKGFPSPPLSHAVLNVEAAPAPAPEAAAATEAVARLRQPTGPHARPVARLRGCDRWAGVGLQDRGEDPAPCVIEGIPGNETLCGEADGSAA